MPRTIGMKRRPVARKASGRPTTRSPSGKAQASAGVFHICAAWAERPVEAMPIMPPLPAGRLAGRGNRPRPAATVTVPSGQATSRHMAYFRLLPIRARAPQTNSGARKARVAQPKICSSRSAATAPSGPSQLPASRRLALFRLASSGE